MKSKSNLFKTVLEVHNLFYNQYNLSLFTSLMKYKPYIFNSSYEKAYQIMIILTNKICMFCSTWLKFTAQRIRSDHRASPQNLIHYWKGASPLLHLDGQRAFPVKQHFSRGERKIEREAGLINLNIIASAQFVMLLIVIKLCREGADAINQIAHAHSLERERLLTF